MAGGGAARALALDVKAVPVEEDDGERHARGSLLWGGEGGGAVSCSRPVGNGGPRQQEAEETHEELRRAQRRVRRWHSRQAEACGNEPR